MFIEFSIKGNVKFHFQGLNTALNYVRVMQLVICG